MRSGQGIICSSGRLGSLWSRKYLLHPGRDGVWRVEVGRYFFILGDDMVGRLRELRTMALSSNPPALKDG